MKKNLLLAALSCLIVWNAGAAATWTKKKDFNKVRWGAAGFSIGNMGYIGMGGDTTTFWNDFWQYNPSSNTWSQKASLPASGRMFGTGFSIAGKGYMGLGVWYGGYYKDFYEYDPTGNAWTKKTDFGGSGRDQAVGFSIGNKGYIGTGRASNGAAQKDFWQYDPASDTWAQKDSFGGTPRIDAAGFSIGDKGYIGAGVGGGWKKDFWEYDTTSGKWTKKADFPGNGREFPVGFAIGNQGFMGLGADQASYPYTAFYLDFWQYDQASDAWTITTAFSGMGRESAIAFAIGNKGYVSTGINDPVVGTPDDETYLNDLWEYGDGALAAPDDQPISQHSATVYPNPSNGHFSLSYRSSVSEDVLKIFDMSGRLVYQENLLGMKGIQNVNAAALSNGKYYWNISSGSTVSSSGQLVILK